MPDLDTLQTFNSLFSQYRFRIPDYQRGYAWGEKEHRELLEDIASLTDDNEHFTGLLVIHENHELALRVKTRGMVKPIFDVVDGQQRLTTMVILMNEIRRAMLELNTDDMREIAENIQENFLWEPGAGNLQVPKLVMDENNRDFFERNILEMGEKNLVGATMKSHDNLMAARNYFAQSLLANKEKHKEKFVEWLEDLYGKVAAQLKVMVYRLRTESDAGVVFEGMNSRGKKPNSMDLVKNYLLFAASKLEQDQRQHLSNEINKTWTTIFKRLSAAGRADNEDSLLEFHWMTIYDYDRKHWSLEREKSDHVKKKFKVLLISPERHDELFKQVEQYVQTLQNVAVAYTDIYSPTSASAFQIYDTTPDIKREIVKYSEKLIRINTLRPFTPLLIAIRLQLPEKPQAYLEILKLCEKYAFRAFRVGNSRTNSVEVMLFRYGNQFYNKKINLETLIELLQRDLHDRCNDAVFAHEFAIDNLNKWYGQNGSRPGLKYLLYEYEEHLHGGQTPTINWAAIYENPKSIEHILPQNPEEDSDWIKVFTTEQAKEYRHVLGNLTLTEDNSKLGRKSFDAKKGHQGQAAACYAISNLRSERELAGISEWNIDSITKRQNTLTTWAVDRWSVPTPPPLPDNQFEALKQRAEANGLGSEFTKISEIAKRLNLPPKANKNRMSYKSPTNYLLSVIRMYTYSSGMEIWFNFQFFPKYRNVPQEKIMSHFDSQSHWWLPTEKVPEFIERLEALAIEVEANKA
jgi:hypothetical protein